ncbi:MAG: exodeoxyribonuclease V subunit alpha [Balneolaceae bacterium]|jgi:exodeoxyribonuclease V alpha subunit
MKTDLVKNLSFLRSEGIIQDIDLSLYHLLKRQHEYASEDVLLAAVLLSYLYRRGDVCLDIEKYAGQPIFDESVRHDLKIKAPDLKRWQQEISECDFVGGPGDFKPLILDNSYRLYLHKLWYYEKMLAEQLLVRSRKENLSINHEVLKEGLARLFPLSEGIDWQQVAAANAVKKKLSVISGGPGTGKTSTVVKILALLLEQAESNNGNMKIALAAPTGKAAARLKDAILSSKIEICVSDSIRDAIPEETMTIHQLLGARRNTSSFKYDEENPAPYNVVVLDEASMVDQALMCKLLQALLEDTQLIMLGDKDQLASVEAGAVLGDICDLEQNYFSKGAMAWFREQGITVSETSIIDNPKPLTDNITLLVKSYRFDSSSSIGQLADSINQGDSDRVLKILKAPEFKGVGLSPVDSQAELERLLRKYAVHYFEEVRQNKTLEEAIESFNNFRILAAHRRGPWGVESLNNLVESMLRREHLIPKYQQWYPGKPVIINKNDYAQRLHNGDTGICLPDREGRLKVYFMADDIVRGFVPSRLPDHSRAYALTVHKSQGSEFDNLLIILPNTPSKILTRELFYTAVTRARKSITILGKESIIKKGIENKLIRSSGLREKLWGTEKSFPNTQ